MPVRFPDVTPPEYDEALSVAALATVPVKLMPSGPVQLLSTIEVMVAMPVPDSPVPLATVALAVDEAQVIEVPVAVSLTVVVPAEAVVAPPGVAGQVVGAA